MNGAIILDKPAGITSHDAVRAVRRIFHERSVGHIGTLDPFATGVLVMLLGKATRLARYFGAATKTYEAVMRVGFATDTYDFTGTAQGPDRHLDLNPDDLTQLFGQFVGRHLQTPPAYSAKKVGGVAAYRLARKGSSVELAPVEVSITELALLDVKEQLVSFSVTTSSGTYIRSLAHDLGQRLGVGAHLTNLRRTAVGDFKIGEAMTLDAVELQVRDAAYQERVLKPMESLLLELPAYVLSADEYARVMNGQSVFLSSAAAHLRLFSPEGSLAAIAEHEHEGWHHPQVVLCGTPSAPTAKHQQNPSAVAGKLLLEQQ
jgi:tRNA pseudouridine55 synthase